MNHPDKVDLVNPVKAAAKNDKPQTKRSKTSKQTTQQRIKPTKAKKPIQTTKVEKPKPVTKQRRKNKAKAPPLIPDSKTVKPALKAPRMSAKTEQPKTKQLKLT
jgi:hypothetical protein